MEEIKQPLVAAKRLWHILRIFFTMMKRGFLKHRFTIHFHLMLQRGKHAGKNIGSLFLHHYSDISCRADGVDVIPSVHRYYQYSCSSTPAYHFPSFHPNKTKRYRRRSSHHDQNCYVHSRIYPEYSGKESVAASFRKAFEVLNSGYSYREVLGTPLSKAPYGSPYPLVRITDSPFPLMDEDEDRDYRIDREAEDFINRFYEQLRSQDQWVTTESLPNNDQLPAARSIW